MGLGRIVHLRSGHARGRRPLDIGVAALVAAVLGVGAAPADALTTPVFGSSNTLAVGQGTRGLSTADLNGDGKLDVIAVHDYYDGVVEVFLNTTPANAPAASFTRTSAPLGMAAVYTTTADINGDGKLDIIAAGESLTVADSVLINTTSDGATTPTFAEPFLIPDRGTSRAVAAVDLNADGKPDLANASSQYGRVSVRFNMTSPGADTPTFSAVTDVRTNGVPTAITAADLDADGSPDLIVGDVSQDHVLLNRTPAGADAPSFAPIASFPDAGGIASEVHAVDLNEDGRLDLVTSKASAPTAQVLLNSTAPGAATPSFGTAFGFGPATDGLGSDLADLNGDGKPDVVTGDYHGEMVRVWLNTMDAGAGTPTFAGPTSIGERYPLDVTTADVNGDGKPDLVTAAYPDLSVRLNQPLASIADASGTESSGKVTFTLTLDVAVAQDTTVDLKLTDGTATAPDDYDATTLKAIFPAGQKTTTVSVPVAKDGFHEPDETFTATLANPSTGIAVGSGTATGTIIDPRYAVPTGGLASGDCAAAAPCDLVTAIDGAAEDDTVIVESGTYGSPEAPVDGGAGLNPGKTPLTIRGEHPGGGRPVIHTQGNLYDAGVASDLVIRATGSQDDVTAAITLLTGATASRIDAFSESGDGCELAGAHSELSDSVCWTTSTIRSGITLRNFADLTLRNDTAVGVYGLYNEASAPTVINSILHSTRPEPSDVSGARATATFINDQFATVDGGQPTSTGQVTAEPKFIDAAHGDFRQAPGSPGIDAGLDDVRNGSQDVAGAPRTFGPHTDIGAHESTLVDATVKDATVTEGATAQVAVTLTHAYATPVTVFYETADGTASAGADYTATRGILEFAAGQTTKDIQIATTADKLSEGDETFTLTAGGDQATVTIADDDSAPAPVVTPPVVTPPVITPPIVNLPAGCTRVPLNIVEIAPLGSRVRVSGLADARRFAGHTVTILTPSGTFATTKVAEDGTFTATAKRNGATRFTARLDSGQRSLLFGIRRSITVVARKSTAAGTRVTFKVFRHRLPRTASIRRQVGCTGYRIIGHTTINQRTGRGTVTLALPTGDDPLAVYRIVATLPGGQTFTLPIAIPAAHRTRG